MSTTGDAHKLRPYQDSSEFAQYYNISFDPKEGVIDHHTGRPISFSLPTTLQYNNQQNHGSGITSIGIGLKKGSRAGGSAGLKRSTSSLSSQIGGKNMYSDLELQEYFDFNNLKELLKTLVHSFIKNYVKIVISQPFEVTRFILQVGSFNIGNKKLAPEQAAAAASTLLDEYDSTNLDDDDDDDDDEEDIEFFASTGDSSMLSPGKSHSRVRRKSNIERSVPSIRNSMVMSGTEKKSKKNHIKPVSLNTMDIMTSLLSKEGNRGLWRAINTSFIYQTLSRTIEAWLTGFLSPFLNVPDPFFIDIIHSSNPFKSLCLSVVAGALTAIILQPVDLIRVKFIITSTLLKEKRSFKKIISSYEWKDYLIPTSLVVPTLNYNLMSIIFKRCTPYLLFTRFNIEKTTSPAQYWIITLFASVTELFIKLPLELLLRRAQLHYLLSEEECDNDELRVSKEELSVQFGGYFGYLTTLYYVFKGTVPGYAISQYPVTEYNDNKGVEAIFRGWRVGLVNVLGTWGADLLNETSQSSFKEEKF